MTSKTILSQVKGFTPLIDILVEKHDLITAAVFGRAWRYCQMENRICSASAETIAEELSISTKTVRRRLRLLCQEGYLRDETPNRRNAPHVYSDTGKAQLVASIEAKISQTESPTKEDEVGQRVQAVGQRVQAVGQRVQARLVRESTEDSSLRENKERKKKAAAAKNSKPEPSLSLPDQSDWTDEDHASLEVVLYSWTKEFGKMSTDMIEKMIALWNLYPEEEIHEYAWNEMVEARNKRKVRPNLAYYEKCLATEARTNWVLNEGGNGHEPET